jgi:hypothetical protein
METQASTFRDKYENYTGRFSVDVPHALATFLVPTVTYCRNYETNKEIDAMRCMLVEKVEYAFEDYTLPQFAETFR